MINNYDSLMVFLIVYGISSMLMFNILLNKVAHLINLIKKSNEVSDNITVDSSSLKNNMAVVKNIHNVDLYFYNGLWTIFNIIVNLLPYFVLFEILIFMYSEYIQSLNMYIYYALSILLSIINGYLVLNGIRYISMNKAIVSTVRKYALYILSIETIMRIENIQNIDDTK